MNSQLILNELMHRFPELGRDCEDIEVGDVVGRLCEWISYLESAPEPCATAEQGSVTASELAAYLASARNIYCCDGYVEIDSNAALSVGSDVVWVGAWVAVEPLDTNGTSLATASGAVR